MGAQNEECRAVSQTDLTRSFVPSVAMTTLSKEWIDKIDKFPDKNFHASVILWFAKNQAVMNTTASSW